MVGSNRCTPGADARRAKRRSRDASCATIRRRRPLVLAEAAQTMRAGRGVELTVGVDAARSVAAVATRRRDGIARFRRRARLALASHSGCSMQSIWRCNNALAQRFAIRSSLR